MKMNGNKSPGTDGLSVEFYKSFWSEIGDILVDSFNEAFTKNILSELRNTSIMSLIYKKGDRTDMKNYRPISLTNTDYKTLAHILANRLHQVLHKIISTDQTGYIKTRYIGTYIRKILDTAEYLTKNDSSGIFLFLDFEKAFDTVEWPFLFKVLGKLNFRNEFIKWIKLLYQEPYAILKNNDWLSDKINLKQGIRQGCPASALLFILVVDVLAIRLKKSSSIFFKFIWGKQDLVKIMTLIANISEGGLNMMDIDSQMSACRATWIHKIINNPGNWAFLGKKLYRTIWSKSTHSQNQLLQFKISTRYKIYPVVL